MSTARDTQRQRAYKAEQIAHLALYGTPFGTPDLPEMVRSKVGAAKALARRIERRKLWAALCGFKPGRGVSIKYQPRRAGARAVVLFMEIETGPGLRRSSWMILHEMAHIAAGLAEWQGTRQRVEPGHGWRWADAYLRLVRAIHGRTAYLALRAAFKQQRVRYTRPRTLSPAAREAAAARLAAIRAAKLTPTEIAA